jgi:hypothetical protein
VNGSADATREGRDPLRVIEISWADAEAATIESKTTAVADRIIRFSNIREVRREKNAVSFATAGVTNCGLSNVGPEAHRAVAWIGPQPRYARANPGNMSSVRPLGWCRGCHSPARITRVTASRIVATVSPSRR